MAMAVDFVVGKAFEALYAGVEEVIRNNLIFSDLCKDIKDRLDCLAPLIDEMGKYNQQLDLTEELEALEGLIKRGTELVGKCSKLGKWSIRNIYKKQKYSNEFLEFKESLQKELEVLKVRVARDVKKTEVAVESMAREVKKTGVAAENIQVVLQNIQGGVSLLLKKNEDLEIEALSAALPELPELIVGLEVPLEELKVKILKDEGSMLILTAPAGCGKTTLATKLCQDQDIKDKFQENIFFVTFTKKPNLERIMKGLYEQKGYKGPASHNEATPVKWLERVEMEKGEDPLLLVLDDVWSGSEPLLEKFQFKMSNYKILVTSRSLFPKFGPSYHLQLLDYENAMQLFHHTASLGDKSSHIPEQLSKEIVKYCNGFPLTITVAGRSLCGQPEEMWRSRVDEWSESSSILDFETGLLLQLQTSMDVLDNAPPKVKKCFFDLGAFPGDAEIQVTALFDMWAELYDLKKETSCIGKLYELNNRGLALLQEPDGDKRFGAVQEAIDYSEYVVRQHDLLRKLAIYNLKGDPVEDRKRLIVEICGNKFPKWWREQKYPYINARLVSISTDREFLVKLPNMEFPEAEVLILNFQSDTSFALPEFVERMHKLKMLLVLNYSGCYVEMDNFELLGSLSNLRSLRLEGINFSCITKSPVQLKNLHKLYLRAGSYEVEEEDEWSYDDEVPVELSYVFPNINEMVIEAFDFWECPAGLCELVHLTKLKIISSGRNSFELPEAIGNLVSLEVLKLENFGVLPDSIGNLKKLKLLIISRFYSKDALPESIGNLVSLEVLRVEDCKNLSAVPDSIGNLKKLKFLKISNNNAFQFLPEQMGKLKCLRHLIIDRCDRLYQLPESIGKLINLEVLSLRYCYILSELPKSIIHLQKLNLLDIDACCRMEELPENIGELKSLRKLQMVFCNVLRKLPQSVSHLVQLEEVVCEDWQARELWTPLLPTLKNLRIVVWKAK
ncbi:hypothetical protein ACLB2K_061652 [Fragaria x ananassa]